MIPGEGGGNGEGVDLTLPGSVDVNAAVRWATVNEQKNSKVTISDNAEVVIPSQDAGAVPLTIKCAESQTADSVQVQNSSSVVKARIDKDGNVHSNTPESEPGDSSIANGQHVVWINSNNRYQIKGKKSSGTVVKHDVPNVQNGELIVQAEINTSVPLMAVGHATQAVDLIQARDNSSNVKARIDKDGNLHSNTPESEPGDSSIANGQHLVWIDSNNRYQIKGKKSSGTVVKHDISVKQKYALLTHRQDVGVDGGGISSGSMATRPITHKDIDEIGITLSSNQIILPAGTYRIHAELVNYNVGAIRSKLRNISDSSNVPGVFNPAHLTPGGGTNIHPHSKLLGQFTLAATKTLEIQQQVSSTQGTNGFGKAANLDSLEEVYAVIEIWKIA